MILRLLIFFATSAFSIGTFAQSEVGIAELPDWVEQLPIEEFRTDRTAEFQFGIANLLSDRQVRKTESGFDYAQRTVYRIVDRSGLESSATLAMAFDPATETMGFNFVRILRDGEVVDHLPDAEITVLRQEPGLGSSVIDGNLTALIYLEDVRVGDVIDYSVSGSVETPLWPDEIFENALVEWSVPLAQSHYKLSVPESLAVSAKSIATDVRPEISIDGGWRSYTVHVFDPDPVAIELNIPPDWITYGFVTMSSMQSWSDVVDWAMPHFSPDDALPAPFIDRLDRIEKSLERPRDQAIEVLRLVQSEIRYLGLEMGLGSHVPRPPSVTLERGYGDCKDKAVLLVAALDYLGIDATPALASVLNGKILPQLPPSIGAFDHVIVEVDFGDEQIWVDPTLTHQGGNAENLAPLGYGHILPVKRSQSALVDLPEPLPDDPLMEIAETFEFPATEQAGLKISAERIFRGQIADAIRYSVASLGREALARSQLDHYAALYEVTAEGDYFAVSDDLDANEIALRVQFEVEAARFADSDLVDHLPLHVTAIQDVLPRTIGAERASPLGLPYGFSARHVVRVRAPGHFFPVPEGKSTTVGGVSYAVRFEQFAGELTIEHELVVADEAAALESAESILDLADEIARDSQWNLNMESGTRTLLSRLGVTDIASDRETGKALSRIDAKFGESEFVAALTETNALLDRHREATEIRGALQLLKGFLLTSLRRTGAAIESYEEAFRLFEPPTVDGYLTFAGTLAAEENDERGAEIIITMLEKRPEISTAISTPWVRSYLSHLLQPGAISERETLVLALARAIDEGGRDHVDSYQFAIADAVRVLAKRQEPDAAHYLSLLSDPAELADLLMSRESEPIWDEIEAHAGKGLVEVLESRVSKTRERLDEAPEDYGVLTRHLRALRMAGKFAEAAAIAEEHVENWSEIEAVGSDAYWFVDQYAYALYDDGRHEEANALMTRLIDIGVAENPRLVSMAINRAALMLDWGDFEGALDAASELEALGDGYASDYGSMWIYHVKACALQELGRFEEAQAVWNDTISPIAEANRAAQTKTALCLDRDDDAADIIIERLRDESNRRVVLGSFMKEQRPGALPPYLTELRRKAESVRQRPDVSAAFDEIGRVITIAGSKTYWSDF